MVDLDVLSRNALSDLAPSITYVQTSSALTQDAATHNTSAIQAALNGGNVVQISGIVPINATLLIGPALSSVLQGNGNWMWQNSIVGGNGAALVWMGAAGIPMVQHQTYFGGSIKNIHFIGDPNNQPSCAIQLTTAASTNVTVNDDDGIFENLFIGASYLGTHDNSVQFQNGILISGTSNGDTHSFKSIHIKGVAGYAIYNSNLSANIIKFDTLHINYCATGIRSNAGMSLANIYMGTVAGYCFQSDGGNWDVTGFSSEVSGGLLQVTPAAGGASYTTFVLNNGQFAVVAANLVSNHYVVDVTTAAFWRIDMTGFTLLYKQAGAPEAILNFANPNDGLLYGKYNVDLSAYLNSHTLSANQNIISGTAQHATSFLAVSGGGQ